MSKDGLLAELVRISVMTSFIASPRYSSLAIMCLALHDRLVREVTESDSPLQVSLRRFTHVVKRWILSTEYIHLVSKGLKKKTYNGVNIAILAILAYQQILHIGTALRNMWDHRPHQISNRALFP